MAKLPTMTDADRTMALQTIFGNDAMIAAELGRAYSVDAGLAARGGDHLKSDRQAGSRARRKRGSSGCPASNRACPGSSGTQSRKSRS